MFDVYDKKEIQVQQTTKTEISGDQLAPKSSKFKFKKQTKNQKDVNYDFLNLNHLKKKGKEQIKKLGDVFKKPKIRIVYKSQDKKNKKKFILQVLPNKGEIVRSIRDLCWFREQL